jgi:hypothetical protein
VPTPGECVDIGVLVGAPLLLLLLLLLQELPPRSYTGADTVAWLRDSLLTLRLEGTAAADVAVSGAQSGAAPTAVVCCYSFGHTWAHLDVLTFELGAAWC